MMCFQKEPSLQKLMYNICKILAPSAVQYENNQNSKQTCLQSKLSEFHTDFGAQSLIVSDRQVGEEQGLRDGRLSDDLLPRSGAGCGSLFFISAGKTSLEGENWKTKGKALRSGLYLDYHGFVLYVFSPYSLFCFLFSLSSTEVQIVFHS
ncbi:hypothetical protein GOODEAATRI_031518 [Goodea atripinnis]|uniref:Uncharacterized protein n=1 Tax=Goodea atripinnis TaxID=208336 RepID=A0ABV0N5T6_9TELE